MIHVAGVPIAVNNRARQLCAWCGEVLYDEPYPNGVTEPWENRAFVRVEAGSAWRVHAAMPIEMCLEARRLPVVRLVFLTGEPNAQSQQN